MNKIIKFSACTYKSKNVAQSQRNCASFHGGETVSFRNSVEGEGYATSYNVQSFPLKNKKKSDIVCET